MKVVVVTGGAGFLGRNLCARLLKNNDTIVYCIDNLITGSTRNIHKFFVALVQFLESKYDLLSRT